MYFDSVIASMLMEIIFTILSIEYCNHSRTSQSYKPARCITQSPYVFLLAVSPHDYTGEHKTEFGTPHNSFPRLNPDPTHHALAAGRQRRIDTTIASASHRS